MEDSMATTKRGKKTTGKAKKKSIKHRATIKKHPRKKTAAKSSTTKKKGGKVSPFNSSSDKDSAADSSTSTSKSAKKTASDERNEKITSGAKDAAETAMKKLEAIQKEVAAPPRESSAKRSQSGTGNNPTPPEERSPAQAGTQVTAAADMAAGAISAARDHLVRQEETERRLKSDPRYERDQEVFKKGQEGKLALVPPSEAEVAALAERTGISEEVADKIPKTPEEQIADDKKRLAEADKRAEQLRGARAGESSDSHNSGGTTTGTKE
jgi:hypothetical protein